MNKKNQNHIISITLVAFIILSVDPFLHLNTSYAAKLIGSISNEEGASGLEYNPSNEDVYFSYGTTKGFVAAIDSSTNLLYSISEIGANPGDLEYNPSNEDLYIANEGSDTVSVLDSSNNTVVKTINVGDRPTHVEYSPSNEDVYVANFGSDDVYVIDSSTNTVIGTVNVGLEPIQIEYIPNSEDIYVGVGEGGDLGDPAEGYIVVIDTSTNMVKDIIGNVSIPLAIENNPSNGKVYVANAGTNSITVIDSSTNTVEDVVNLNAVPIALQYNDANGDLYAAAINKKFGDNNGFVAVIDGSSNIFKDVYGIGVTPREIGYNPTDNKIYVANEDSNDVYVIDSETNTSVNLIPLGLAADLNSLEYNPSNHNIYLASSGHGDNKAITIIAPDNFALESGQNTQVQKLFDLLEDLVSDSGTNISSNLLNESFRILTDDDPDNDAEICELIEANPEKIITPNQSDDLETILKC